MPHRRDMSAFSWRPAPTLKGPREIPQTSKPTPHTPDPSLQSPEPRPWTPVPQPRTWQCVGAGVRTATFSRFRGTAPIRNSASLAPYSKTKPRAIWTPSGGRAVSYERGTLVEPSGRHACYAMRPVRDPGFAWRVRGYTSVEVSVIIGPLRVTAPRRL